MTTSVSRHSPLALAILACLLSPAALAFDVDTSGDVQPRTLDTIEVHGERVDDAGYTVRETSAATGLDLSLRHTPQTVSVITRQQIEDQQIRTLDDVLATAPGINASSLDVGGRTTYRARGFNITNFKVDGLQINGASGFDGAGPAFNLDLYENAQIVRGANGLLGGTGDPSATVYLQRKRPGRTLGGSAALSVDRWGAYRVSGDANLPLTADGSIRARVVVSDQAGDTFRDRQENDARGALLNLEADLSAGTVFNVGYQYESSRLTGASWGANVPVWYADGTFTDLPRSFNPVADWSVAKRDARTFFAGLSHDWGNGWQLQANVARNTSNAYNHYGIAKANNVTGTPRFDGFPRQDGTGMALNIMHSELEGERDNLDLRVSGPLRFAGREHQVMAGFNGYENQSTSYIFNRALGNCTIDSIPGVPDSEIPAFNANSCQWRITPGLAIDDWRTWDGTAPNVTTFLTHARTVDTTRLYGGYLAGRFSLADSVNLIAGARLSQYKVWRDTYNAANAGTRGNQDRERDVITPYAGITWDFADHYTLYASYTDVFTPQGDVRDANDRRLDPVTGQSKEVGIKGAFADGRVNASLSIYHNLQDGVAENTQQIHPDTGFAIYRAVDGVKSEGVELEINGQITPSWNINGGYAYQNVEGLARRGDPRHQLRVTTSYTLPGAWSRLTVGGGIFVQSATEWSTNPGRPVPGSDFVNNNPDNWIKDDLTVGGFTRANLMARYDISDSLQVALNVNNVTDKTYYQQYGFYDGMIYAEPRNWRLTLRARF